MNIAICLPSLNEESTIRFVTQTIDKGLIILKRKYNIRGVIINVDSNSTDNTVDLFLQTPTTAKKYSHSTKGTFGKGENLIWFFKYALKTRIDIGLTIDSDLKSITPLWIVKFVEAIIIDGADYVVPIYKRSRFEGSTTNHFAYPIVKALSGIPIRQPIAGDFGFSAFLIEKFIIKSEQKQNYILEYGIDVFMTFIASCYARSIKQIILETKVHAPSFSKMEYMFPQIANSVLSIIDMNILAHRKINNTLNTSNSFIINDKFVHKKSAITMFLRAKKSLTSSNVSWLPLNLKNSIIHSINIEDKNEENVSDLWSRVLCTWFLSNTKKNISGNELLPFFIIRATSFWFWAENQTTNKINEAIEKQSQKINTYL